MNKICLNNVFNFSASSTMFMIYACGVIPTGFFIANRCSDSSSDTDYIEYKKSGSNKNFQNLFFKLAGAILKTETSDLKVLDLDVKI